MTPTPLSMFRILDTARIFLDDTSTHKKQVFDRVIKMGVNKFAIVWQPSSVSSTDVQPDPQSISTMVSSNNLLLLEPNLKQDWRLYQNYPNPNNYRTMIPYEVPLTSLVTIKVLNILDEEVSTLVNRERIAPGLYTVAYDLNK